ncbi:MAG: gliding motility-associated C-terminal domain-containing protein, partial [Saprospiraceae bacterium]|nr:gliding motility-associated C-terminal domain-containing protein [Saprospiraceae bacterium]
AIAAGTQQDFVISNAAGCDSTITVIVEELLPTMAQLELGACTGTTIDFNGTTYQIGDQDQITLTNAVGCDSVIQLTVVELMPTSETLSFEVCAGESFDWNGSTIAAGSSQSFTLVNAVGCDSTLTIEVDELALPDFDYDISESCPSSSTGAISLQNVTGGLPPYLVSFDGGPFESMNMLAFSDLPQGEYWVAIQDANGCTSEQLLSIDASEAIEIVAQNQVLECDQSQIMLDVQVLSGQTDSLKITWPDGSNGFTFMAMEAGSYPVSIQNECETITTSIEVSYPQGGLGDLVYIPNAFSPNDDGFNDIFRVEQTPGISFVNFKLHLFDRWGNQVFTTENPGEGWNGAYKSRVQNTGVYIWHLEADVQYCGRVIELDEKGDVVLMK